VLHAQLVKAAELPVVQLYSGLFIHIRLGSGHGVIFFFNVNLICKYSGVY